MYRVYLDIGTKRTSILAIGEGRAGSTPLPHPTVVRAGKNPPPGVLQPTPSGFFDDSSVAGLAMKNWADWKVVDASSGYVLSGIISQTIGDRKVHIFWPPDAVVPATAADAEFYPPQQAADTYLKRDANRVKDVMDALTWYLGEVRIEGVGVSDNEDVMFLLEKNG